MFVVLIPECQIPIIHVILCLLISISFSFWAPVFICNSVLAHFCVQKEDACQKCGLNDNLVSCSTCTYSFHRKCLTPCLNITSDKWSCPECVCICSLDPFFFHLMIVTVGIPKHVFFNYQVSPLTEMEKILDCETPKVASEETSSSESISKKKPVKRYLIKWKGLSHIHCTW